MAVFNGTDAGETLVGTTGDDVFHSSKGQDLYSGGDGNDKLIVDFSSDTSDETLGGSIFSMFDAGYGFLSGAETHIEFVLFEELEYRGSAGSDHLYADLTSLPDFKLSLDGGAGSGVDLLTIIISPTSGAVTGSLATSLHSSTVSISGFEQIVITLGFANDNLTLGAGDDTARGENGNDFIAGAGGVDTLVGGWGADRLEGGEGNDRLHSDNDFGFDFGTEVDVLNGGAGDDSVSIGAGDSADGGTGTDQLSLNLLGASAGVTLNLASMFAGATIIVGGGTIKGFESYGTINGTDFADTIATGNAPKGSGSGIYGAGGNDTITTGNLDDMVIGGVGDDTIRSGAGNDTVDGGDGSDRLFGEAGDDIIFGGDDNLNDGNDVAYGGDGADRIVGGYGSDDLFGEVGDDVVEGGIGDDRLYGAAGNDTLNGGFGTDRLEGGIGDDIYGVDNPADIIVEAAGAGNDEVRAEQASFSIAGNANVENLTGIGYLDQELTGNAGANVIDGGIGADRMIGGAGNDIYLVDNENDWAVEDSGGGIDEVRSSVTYVMDFNVENLLLTGFAETDGFGNDLANTITGNNAINILDGGAGNDRLDGGAGNDGLIGGLGADELICGTDFDLIVYVTTEESSGASVDTIRGFQSGFDVIDLSLALAHSVTFAASGGMTVVTAETVDGTLTINVEGTVTAADVLLAENLFWGTAANDQLTGTAEAEYFFGGAGADTMTGGLGDDYYFVDDSGDQVVESPGGGRDLVESRITYALGAEVEDLLLAGSDPIDGTGNALDNIIIGNLAANVLSGQGGNDVLYGGGGVDTLRGGAGNDLYIVDFLGTATVVETSAADGVDTVESDIGFVLGANVENLTLTGFFASDGVGNDLANVLIGNDAENSLTGGGGADTIQAGGGNDEIDGGLGADRMQGGGGDDLYVVDNAADVVEETDFAAGNDTVRASISYTLGEWVDALILTGTAANGTGNAGNNVLAGNAGANRLDGGEGIDVMEGGSGNDVYVVDDAGDQVIESALGGTDRVESSISYVLGTNVENLTLLGFGIADGTGNALANVIVGSDVDNLLDGREGADRMEGREGNDVYIVDNLGDMVIDSGFGLDEVRSSVSFVLSSNVENLLLTGTGNINGTGNALDNMMFGNAGNNVLDGGGSGYDMFEGGAGNDTYVIGTSGGNVIEAAGGGIDTVVAAMSWALDDSEIENLTLIGSATDAFGNIFANLITGNAGANRLDGGLGADTMRGGAGNDTYVVDEIGDTIVEAAAEGTDAVESAIDWVLAANVENLYLTGEDTGTGEPGAGGTGNALANLITGNSAANRIDGAGGTDTMSGGTGDDTYIVDNAADHIIEGPSFDGGVDSVESNVSFVLEAFVENLTLTGAGAINATGNTLANILTGNAAANLLDGGAGADTMTGGNGNDTYLVDDAGDQALEAAAAGGTDLVQSAIGYTLAANLENLTLTGAGAIDGTGNGLANVLTGNGAANLLDGGAGADTMRGGAGNDTYIVGSSGDQAIETLAGDGVDSVQSSVNFVLGSFVENLFLTGTLSVNGTGNGLANELAGNGAANRLDGGAGADTMRGGAGHDLYIVDNVGDQAIETFATDGSDTVQSSVSFALGGFLETLILTGTAANGTGNALANQLTGNAGANRLDGGGAADVMWGGAGNDVFIADASGDRAIELASADGTDKVEASANYQLGAFIENLTLTGTARINGTGNGLANFIVGNDNANVLNGSAGADTMRGGAGDDIYIVDNVGDRAIETDALGGLDSVRASVSFTLASFVENLTLTGIAVGATGNSLDNFIVGNDGANQIDGKAGADTMRGGAGNDTYIVDNAGDRVLETEAAHGTDLVKSSVSFTLGNFVENLTLTGSGAVSGSGNALANFITGNAAANILDGKAGADTMRGGAGNDTYIVDNAGDRAVEAAAGDGTDTVQSNVSFTLGGFLENLTLTGAAAINATGNSAANALTGNNAANLLNGMAGSDTLVGGGGADDFLFTTALGATNVDVILDLQTGVDDIVLENAVFTGLAVGALAAGAFRTGAAAVDADDRILYDPTTGALYFDADGSGAGAAVQFASLQAGLALGAGEFQVI